MVDLLDLLKAQWILLASTNGCKFAWKPPKDDGGCPIEHYIVEKFDVDNGIWSLVGTSPTCDITCNDLKPGKEYEFRVRAVNSEGESENLKSLKPIVAKDPLTVPLPRSILYLYFNICYSTDYTRNKLMSSWILS